MTTTTTTFPSATGPEAKAVVLLDATQMLALYNAGPSAAPEATTKQVVMNDDVQAWVTRTAIAAGWAVAEFVGDTCILKALKPTPAVASSTTKPSARAATGSDRPMYRW